MTKLIFDTTIEAKKINPGFIMHPSRIYRESHEIPGELSQFDVSVSELQQVALAAISARNEATALHPQNAPGMYSYMAGVAALRALFIQKRDWEIARPNGVEAVANKRLEKLILFQNVDFACGRHDPNPVSSKGRGVAALVDNPSGYLWDYMAEEARQCENLHTWFFCVSCNGDEVRAELSRPRAVENGNFGTFAERIFIIQDEDWNPAGGNSDNDSDADYQGEEFDITVTKKR
ncbi:hypothetical protein [Microbulbifer taiwanensis]|uniref:Uncharacterized protein n=1 Tax=Microbulbifer taiwanensis TaxID=986746 RepID=A0ABW1YM41_9GAMM|nr:hypothetical protein [Microbulbifer taiwanensis]